LYNPLDLSGKLVLVTGASSGIGRATAIVLSRMGARLILAGRRIGALEETLAAMKNCADHICSTFDLTDLDGIPKWIAEVVGRAGTQLDGVVHSAGLSANVPLRAMSRSNIDKLIIPNVSAALMLLRGATAKLVAAPAGMSIVLISSVAAIVPSPGLITYSATKSAINAIARSAAKELAVKDIRVNSIIPGYVRTPMLTQFADEITNFEHIEKQQFLGMIEPEEIGVMAAYLLSGAARSITGSQFVMDGGFTL
jgi:NAD(P)-dependent dehydrogenase (short-subunit alcohol dehydrogenase family)